MPQISNRMKNKHSANNPNSSNSTAARKKNLMKMHTDECVAMRRKYPYLPCHDRGREDNYFFTETQERTFNEVIMAHDNKFVVQRYIDMVHVAKKPGYFAEARAILEELGLLPIMNFAYDFNEALVARLFATVHFHTQGDSNMT